MKTNSLRPLALVLLLCSPMLVAEDCATHHYDPSDLMLHGDPLGMDGKPAPMVPYAPAVDPGGDGEYGTSDDIVISSQIGDVDIRVHAAVGKNPKGRVNTRTGRWIPAAVAEPFGEGRPIDFFVVPSDGSPTVPGGHYVASPSLGNNAVLGAAFADLDGDGYIGITHLDGDLGDAALEEHELTPIGRRLATMRGGRYAQGELHVAVGGPPGAELDVVVAAVAVTGSLDPNNPESALPTGTAVMTRLPFYPNLVTEYRTGGAPDPNGLFALELEAGIEPNPGDSRIGERFTLRTDDSELTLGTASSQSGAFAKMGIGRTVTSLETIGRRDRFRPGVSVEGERVLYQILDQVFLAPDADASTLSVELLPLDRLGNVSHVDEPTVVTLSTTLGVRILSPDLDGDPTREALVFSGTTGIPLVLDDEGDLELGRALLVLEAGGVLSRLEVSISDLDVDGSGTIDHGDIRFLKDSDSDREDDRNFDSALDLNGDGRIDEADLAIAIGQQP